MTAPKSDSPLLRIGTRGSPLAMAQALEARDRLAAAVPALAPAGAMEVVEIKTTGDAILDRPLAEVGGKGLFTKELDAALLDDRIDIAVHSVKDVETFLPDGVVLAACLEREDPRDAFLSLKAPSLAELPAGSVVGSASLRRQAQILNRRPDLKVTLIRGNVQTRLAKLAEGACDATLLALAGLNRLGMAAKASAVLSPEEMLPAVGQGAIGITCRAGDMAALEFLAAVDHAETNVRIRAERALLAALDGSCRTPIGGLAEISGGRLRLRGLVAKADGSAMYETEREGSPADAEALGDDAGRELRARAGDDLFA
jgi:hydroxymethylbilane synthase